MTTSVNRTQHHFTAMGVTPTSAPLSTGYATGWEFQWLLDGATSATGQWRLQIPANAGKVLAWRVQLEYRADPTLPWVVQYQPLCSKV
jgi:hypothetical protein